ncbi:MAG: response regulator transcription factor [Deltaproteobacteria bacterium]
MNRLKVLIADDHSIVRDGLRQLINSQADMKVVSEAKDGRDALEKARSARPDVVLLDIGMPQLSGLDVARLIKERLPDCRIVVLSMHENEAYVHQLLDAGALGYVLKTSASTEVLEAIRAASRNEFFLSSSVNAEVINSYLKNRREKPVTRGYDLLTEREQQVFRLIAEGNTTAQIAEILCVSPKTVEKYRANITSKLGLQNLVEMVKYAVKIGIVQP